MADNGKILAQVDENQVVKVNTFTGYFPRRNKGLIAHHSSQICLYETHQPPTSPYRKSLKKMVGVVGLDTTTYQNLKPTKQMPNNNKFSRRNDALSHPQDQPLVPDQPQNTQPAGKEKKLRATLDIPVTLHKTMKRLLLEEDLTIKQYLLQLIEQDLECRGISYK
ncbi:hypothetical protein [Paracnuella aquatica]|uniref:hypothetical protein n=1 Tax=Paracnuella aquatica TaxID=2268757 RepID=UPI000DEF0196|nr:hypothetical protein [Paracnuella aquatica]RPD51160.1 hypothetical protein DRJ53_00310 [Paracnuella aquatica]